MRDSSDIPKAVELPELAQFVLRLGYSRDIRNVLLKDPMLFSIYFSMAAPMLDLPEHLTESRMLDRDALLEVMEQLTRRLGSRVSAEFAHKFSAGQVAYEYFDDKRSEFHELLEKTFERMEPYFEHITRTSMLSENLERLAYVLGLSDNEQQVLALTLCVSLSSEFDSLITLLLDTAPLRAKVWRALLAITEDAFKELFSSKNILAKTGLVSLDPARARPMTLRPFWVNLLLEAEPEDRFFLKIVKPFEPAKSSHALGRIHPDDEDIITALLERPADDLGYGINVLLHGVRSVDKQAVLAEKLKSANRVAYSLVTEEAHDDDLPALCYIAQRWMEQHRPDDILVVEKAHAVLTRSQSQFFFFFQMEPDDDQEAKSIDERLLLNNPVLSFWITSSSKLLTEDNVGRFLYHCEIKKASRLERRAHVEGCIRGLGLSESLEKELIQFEGLSEQQLKSAIALAGLTAGADKHRTEAHIRQAILRSQQALDRREKDELRTSVTQYSLAYLNTSGRFKPEQIIQALQRMPGSSLCFYGLPGTGKTQLAEHIASMLGKPLMKKHASELLDKYVGETEKRISEMFIEAEEEDAVLLLDEADSFLRDRARSEHRWEVSQVNELLQRMERFKGTFICATNLFRQLDIAALRRFTFKLEFLPLTEQQRWSMFLNEAGINPEEISSDIRDVWLTQLLMMRNLTPGDFATVKRQSVLLGETLPPDAWLSQLELEVRIKSGEISENTDIL